MDFNLGSRTYVGLKESGVLGYTKKAVDRSHEGLQWLHLRIDEQIPGYYEATADYLEVYVQLSKNLAVIGCNIFNDVKDAAIDKYPSVVASVSVDLFNNLEFVKLCAILD